MNGLSKITCRIFSKAKKAGFANSELYFREASAFGVDIWNGDIREYKNAKNLGLGFRGELGDKTGYAYTESFTPEAIDFMIEAAAANARMIDEEKEILTVQGDNYESYENTPEPDNTAEWKIKTAKQMEQAATTYDSRVKQALHSYIGNSKADIFIANSNALVLRRSVVHATAYVYAQAQQGNVTKTGGEFYSSSDFNTLDHIALARQAADNACSLLNGINITTDEYPVVFDNTTFASLLSSYSALFFAENVQKGLSPLTNKKNTLIAAPCVSIIDCAACEKSPIKTAFDDEGRAAHNKAVIENGMLKTYLYNQKSALRDNTQTTGNGFRSSFKSGISTGCLNFYIKPIEGVSENELLQKARHGVYITGLNGLHAGANSITGDFSVKAEGFYIKNGKKSEPIEQFTVSGNFLELLQKITHIADNLRFGMPNGGVFGSPSVLVRALNIAGRGSQ